MFIKNILKGFTESTKIEYHINGRKIDGYNTVGDYMNSGLTTYDSTEAGKLEVKGDKIIIKLETE